MLRQHLIDQLKRHEGQVVQNGRHRLYYDTEGIATIGYGRNLEDRGIADDEAEFLLSNDVDETLATCAKLAFWDGLNDRRKMVVANMVFNLGVSKFLKFAKTIAAIERRDYLTASEEMLDSKWARQVKSRAQELADMMREG